MALHVPDEAHQHPHELLGDFILGLNDGVVTTLVFALSVSGAAGAYSTVITAGLAEMLAGGVSMFLGGYISGKSVKEAAEHQIAVEREEIANEPEEERAELTQIYREKGFSGQQLKGIVDHLTSDPERWLNSLVRDELLMRPGEFRNPWKIGGAIGLAFMAGAFVPLTPFLLHLADAPVFSVAASVIALFGTGAGLSRHSRRSWVRSGVQMAVVGLIGAVAGVIIGRVLSVSR